MHVTVFFAVDRVDREHQAGADDATTVVTVHSVIAM